MTLLFPCLYCTRFIFLYIKAGGGAVDWLVHPSLVQELPSPWLPSLSGRRHPPLAMLHKPALSLGKLLPENDVIYLIEPDDGMSSPAGMDTWSLSPPEMMKMMKMTTGDINDLAFQACLISNRLLELFV